MEIDWKSSFEILLQKYKGKKHPLDYTNRYQLLVMVVLSAQSTDAFINKLAKDFFNSYPSITDLSNAIPEDLMQLVRSVRNFRNKAKWLLEIANVLKEDKNIPHKLAELTSLPGIGRKSANVIIRESGDDAEGVIVDLHVVRVAPRLGIVEGDNPEKIEKQLMAIFPYSVWNDLGMAISFLGRDTCRPSNPKCNECIMSPVCQYRKFITNT
jgi:endonuclease-3